MDDTEKNLMNMRYHNMVSRYRYVNYAMFSFEYNINSSTKLKDRERVAKQIAKTSDSIRKKYRTLKTGKIEKDVELKRHLQPIVEPLKQIVENTAGKKFQPIKKEVNVAQNKNIKKRKPKDNKNNEDDVDGFWMDKT